MYMYIALGYLEPVKSCLHIIRITVSEPVPDEGEGLESFLVCLVREDTPTSRGSWRGREEKQ